MSLTHFIKPQIRHRKRRRATTITLRGKRETFDRFQAALKHFGKQPFTIAQLADCAGISYGNAEYILRRIGAKKQRKETTVSRSWFRVTIELKYGGE